MEQRALFSRMPARNRRERSPLPLFALHLIALIIAAASIGNKLAGQDLRGIFRTAQTGTIVGEEFAPAILGAVEFTTKLGEVVSYYQSLTPQNIPAPPEPTPECSQLDLSRPGKYTAVYTSKDSAGNVTSQTVIVTVLKPEYFTEPACAPSEVLS